MARFPEINLKSYNVADCDRLWVQKTFPLQPETLRLFLLPFYCDIFSFFIHYFKGDILFFFFFFLPVTHCTWSISSTFGNSVPFFIYKFKIHGYSQDLLLKIQVCMSYSLWSLHVNVAEAPQTQQANVNFSSSPQHPSFRLYYFPSMPSTSLNDSVPPQCWILFLLHLSYLVIPETF